MNSFIKHLLLFTVFFYFSQINFSQNINKEDLQNIKSISEQFLIEQKIPGMAISISQNNKLIFSEGFGFANIETKKTINPSKTKFRIASISKTLTAVALAKLVDDKIISLDSSLYTYVTDFPKKKYDFTIRQIGGHLAGIRHYKNKEFLLNKKMSITKGLKVFKKAPLLFAPGEKFKYSTYGFNLLSVVIQNASNQKYSDYMYNSVFKPLLMKNTFIEPLKFDDNTTQFYINRNGNIRIGPKVKNGFKAAGGGFLSTSEDLVKLGYQFIKPSIISSNSLNELTKPQKTNTGKSTNYGIGIAISKNKSLKYGHSGGGVGASTYLLIYPEQEIVVGILTNVSGVNLKSYIKKIEDILVR